MPSPLAIHHSLLAVYSLTYEGQSHEFTFVAGSLPGTARKRFEVPRPWAILSACHPMSVRLTDAEKAARTHELTSALQQACVQRGPACGCDREGKWVEQSRAVFGLDRAEVITLARRFQQRAVVWGSDCGVGILDCLTERLVIRRVLRVTLP